MVSPFIHLSSNGDRQILCRCYEKQAWWGEGDRGSERGHVSPTLHLSPCRRLCATTDKEEKGSTTGMIRHWPRHSLLSSKPVSRWRILSYFFFTFRFLSRRRDEGKEEEGREKSLHSRTAEQAYETAPTDAIRVEFSSSCKHEWKNSSFRHWNGGSWCLR